MNINEELQMIATVGPDNATNKSVRWTITHGADKATITETTGILTANAIGTVTVRATALDGSLEYDEMTVEIIVPVSGVTVSGANGATTVDIGESLQMIATVLPNDVTDKTVTWTMTAGTGDAIISDTGALMGTAKGTVTVKATSNSDPSKYGEMTVEIIVPVSSVEVSCDGGYIVMVGEHFR